MNRLKFPRTEREAFGHPGHAIERYNISNTGDRIVLVVLVCEIAVALLI